jgi:hypothetical protein
MLDTYPQERTLYNGHVGENPVTDRWTVTKKHYMLTELVLYGSSQDTSGFTVKFEAWPKDVFPESEYPPEIHTYGETDQSAKAPIKFTSDLKKIKICVDAYPAASDIYHDFENFEFEDQDGVISMPSTGCQNFMTEDLSENRLIGFQAVVSDYRAGRRNIRSLGVIVDRAPYCGDVPFGDAGC